MNAGLVFRASIGAALTAGLTFVPLVASVASSGHATSPVVNVWTEPSDGFGFLDSAVNSARTSIDLSMYELSDTTLERELVARANAGVDVRVLLDADYEGTQRNASAYAFLRTSKVHVEWAVANQIFHAKYLVVNDSIVYIGSGNLESVDYPSTRDFWVEVTRGADVSAVVRTFDGDFAHATATVQSGGLVWSPGSTSALVGLIASAKRSLLVENEEMDSPSVEAALVSAARRGVDVKVVMTESSSWTAALDDLARSGVHARVLSSSQVYIHAKVICVDCVGGVGTVFIGSENFSVSSLSYNRELGVITTAPKAVVAVDTAVNHDYATGTTIIPTITSVPPTTTGGGTSVMITSFEGSIGPGDEDSLSVHVSKVGETCDLVVTLPSGYTSESHGLGVAHASAGGNITWTWEIGPSTDPGTAHATITCATGRVERNFSIR